jgi:hypothetical protein
LSISSCNASEDRKAETARFRLLEVANLDFNSLMGKAGGWTAFPEEGFNGVTTNIMPQDMAKCDIIDLVWEVSL